MTGHPTSRVRLYLIRHAQSEANLIGTVICGQNLPSALSPLGVEQAVLLGKRLKYQKIKFDHLLCSTAVRAKQTADIAFNLMNIDASKLITTSALLEQSQGSWEGLNRELCYNAEVIAQMGRLHIEFSAPAGESMRMVQKRAIEFLEVYVEQAKKQSIEENREITIAVFTHANLIRAVLQYYMQSTPEHTWLIDQSNTAINEIFFNQYGISIVKINDSGHLIFPIPESTENK